MVNCNLRCNMRGRVPHVPNAQTYTRETLSVWSPWSSDLGLSEIASNRRTIGFVN